ncbi:MAG: IS1595 family transposase [Phycisphaeraceae bacterium]
MSYNSALILLHRVRFAMTDMQGVKLTGTVEVDETYVGGGEAPETKAHTTSGAVARKTPVVGMVERDGRVHTRVAANVTAKTLKGRIRKVVDYQSKIMTDEETSYTGIGAEFAGGHQFVTHSMDQYLNGNVHANTVEGVFSPVKRDMYSLYHNVSTPHFHRYSSEFDFRWNHRKNDDGDLAIAAVRGAEGKRLRFCAVNF